MRQSRVSVTNYTHNGSVVSSTLHLNGRFPSKGVRCNAASGKVIYVIKGSGKVSSKSETHGLSPGSTLLLNASECYYFKGQLSVYMISAELQRFRPVLGRLWDYFTTAAECGKKRVFRPIFTL